MFVYGIRCNPVHLVDLPQGTDADYYTEFGILVFPSYSKPACLRNNSETLTAHFIDATKRLIEHSNGLSEVELEHPYITEDEDAAVKILQSLAPGSQLAWYNIPRVVTSENAPQMVVSD